MLRSVRDRLDATVSGLQELDLLRQRQEVLVRAALQVRGAEEDREEHRSSEERLLEENILLLRRQLNCLRRRDAGLISQLQELDRQISDLRLDAEESHDPPETDSRPSSGFYELSDGTVSLSNSSNSVFSECFCSTADADGRLPSTDELASCLECDGLIGGLCDDPSSLAMVRRSLSATHPPADDAPSKHHCDLVPRSSGDDVYRYPSPLHAVVTQSPAFLQVLSYGGHGRDDVEGVRPEPLPPLVPQSSSWPPQTPHHKRLDSYIYSLLQRRAPPPRTSRPRTSISTEPSKSVLRQASLCARQVSAPSPGPGPGSGTLGASDLKPPWPAEVAASSPQRKWSVEGQEVADMAKSGFKMEDGEVNTNSLLRKRSKDLLPPSTLTKDFKPYSTPKKTKPPCCPTDQEAFLKSPLVVKPLRTRPSGQELAGLGSSPQSQDERGVRGDGGSHMVNARCSPAQQHSNKFCKGGSKTVKVKSMATMKTSLASDHSEPAMERRADKSRHSSERSHLLEDGSSAHIKVSKRGTSTRTKHLPVSIPEGQVLDKHTMSTLSVARSGVSKHHHHGNHHLHHGHHHHHHGREQVVVVAKPKHKRRGYRRLMEVPYDEAFRRAQRRQRKELLSNAAATNNRYRPAGGQPSGPYNHAAGSDSEYSAECASLFHSTIADTSEDDKSNYTTNRFGDSESSQDENMEESTTTSDTEESAGGGRGRTWGQGGAAGQEMTSAQAKAFVKIKASHNLKKKILRFRSGSLKVMTTV